MDIWLSMIDNNGNFGVPINAGSRINSSADEITPFFNQLENKLYFSSNRKGGAGGFDVYSSLGRLNLWNKIDNLKWLNSKDDEMYLRFYELAKNLNFYCVDIKINYGFHGLRLNARKNQT